MIITEKCTGCMACYNACPFDAIEIGENEKGFYVPKINEEKCRKCNKCVAVCPQNDFVEKHKHKEVYAAWSKDKEIRQQSTSGGLFTEIANKVLENNGVIIGAIFDKDYKVVHGVIKSKEELNKTRGSKYVQSYIGSSYKIAKEYLENGKLVLFSGVSCQVAGLKKFLGREYENLITTDILCHGVPSPSVFKQYKEKMGQDEITNIQFRYKKPSWTIFSMKIDYKNGKTYKASTYKDPFIRAFLEDYITNEVCAECKYTGENRVSDITLADFWGYISENYKMRNTEKGISLVMINTEKGKKIFETIKEQVIYREKDIEEAKKGNRCLREPFNKNKQYDEFWSDYLKDGYEKTFATYIKEKKMPLKRKISLLFNDKAYLLPRIVRKKLIKVRDNSK